MAHNKPPHNKLDDLETATETTCLIDRLRAALGSGPGAASERPDGPAGEVARVMAVWGSLSYGGKLEILEAASRATCLAIYAHVSAARNAPLIVEV